MTLSKGEEAWPRDLFGEAGALVPCQNVPSNNQKLAV